MKKLAITCASLLVLICMLFFSPDTVSAEDTSGTCGENAQWSFDATTNTLTISGTGAMEVDHPYNDMPWQRFYGSIYYVVIEDGITHICDNAFEYSGPLKEVTIPKSVTSIGQYAFEGSALTHIELHDCITSIGYSAFSHSRLEEITIPAGVTELKDNLFYYCTNLKKVTLHDSITTIGSSVFWECQSLQSIIIPDSVTELGGSAFNSCSSLTQVTLSKKITSIPPSCFSCCFSLQEISIPDKTTTIDGEAFCYCTSLEKITFGSGLKSISTSAFDKCDNLKEFSISKKNRTFITDEYGVLYSKDKKTLIFVPRGFVGKYTVADGTQRIEDSSVRLCTNLTEIVIPDSVKEIGRYAFEDCNSLKIVDLGNGVQTLGTNAFYNCDSLEILTLPASVTFLDTHALGNCDELHSIVFLGDRPDIEYNFSLSNGAICWYPIENSTWKGNLPTTMYGALDWRPRCTGEHNFVEEEGLPATCTEEGYEAYIWCQTCGFFPEYPQSIPVLEHVFDEWVYITPAGTPEARHRVSHSCTLCGYTETPYASTVDPSELPDPPVLPPEDTSASTEDATTDNTESDTPVKNPIKFDTPTILITVIVVVAACLIGIVLYFTFKNRKTE